MSRFATELIKSHIVPIQTLLLNQIDPSTGRNSLILRARIARCVDGLDVELFRQALDLRRRFLATHPPQPT